MSVITNAWNWVSSNLDLVIPFTLAGGELLLRVLPTEKSKSMLRWLLSFLDKTVKDKGLEGSSFKSVVK